jgi:Asp-tRNA(Asn)/Glu-tRNA(Gln) amidotransferase A subunit family amidase
MLEVMSGADIGDPMAAPYEVREPSDLSGLSIGWFVDDGQHPVTAGTKQAVESAAKALTDQGFNAEPFRPNGLERVRELWYDIFCRFSGLAFGPLLAGREKDLSFLLSDLLRLQSREKPLSAKDVLFTQFERDVVREKFVRQMEKHQILILPVSTGPAFRHGHMGWTHDDRPETFVETMVYSQWFNLLGLPAAVVPVGHSPEGLPIGVQIVGRPYDDYSVCTIASVIEKVFSWRESPMIGVGQSRSATT